MEPCPGCDRVVREVHPLPPEVITKELIDTLGPPASPGELEACAACLDELMNAG